ncbi:hypothetical protein BDEG_27498 [Batrachochytrium dendrobatidis JEL423]|uniref:Peptidase A1 domain-containing protein n=1 Tax=Batrachochytrium dendrobatidis (strain JEL423) TaxID=403673 RepID=A0A177WX55_BATDL|nr:hypothetical protein BDEG_27498 [Batrachochytrium dendrobatidis JEL423]
MVVPLPSSSNDVGLAIQSISSGEPVSIKYKGKQYNGVTSTAVVTIPGTGITGVNLPVLAVEKQSADSVGINPKFDGIFGLAYSSLSNQHSRVTAMDALYNDGAIPKNEVSLQLCPYGMTSESFINIGNTDVTAKCETDGTSVAWVESPSNNQFSVNIKSVLVNGRPAELPAEFQKKVKDGRTLYSSVETCFLYMRFPETVVTALVDAILNSNAITVKDNMLRSDYLDKKKIKMRLWKNHLMPRYKYTIDWSRMPRFSITMFAQTPVTDENRDSVVTIELGPRDYMQIISIENSEKFLFAVTVGSNDYAVLGMSFMTRLKLTFDLQNARIGFGSGCGCETATSEYPTISNNDRMLWPLPHFGLPEEPSTSYETQYRSIVLRIGRIRRGSKRSNIDYKKLGD